MHKHLIQAWANYRPLPRARKPHGLPEQLVVSLTSYRGRFATLTATLRSLLAQTVAPDRLVLWVGHDDRSSLPVEAERLVAGGLEVQATDDLGPYTKIVPALERFPEAVVVTADDDLYYEPAWLEGLVAGHRDAPDDVVCRRARAIANGADGALLPYEQWDIVKRPARSDRLLPNGFAGVLYPPRCLHGDATRRDICLDLAPTADDLWLYWMARLAGRCFTNVGVSRHLINWPGSQTDALWEQNRLRTGGNDDQIARLAGRYGYPFD